MRRSVPIIAAAVLSCAVAGAVAVAVAGGTDDGAGSATRPIVSPAPAATGDATVTPVAVAALRPDTVVLFHEAVRAVTAFDQGVFLVTLDADGTFRRIEGPGVVDGGRSDVRGAVVELPVGTSVVFSYDVDGRPASVYGILGGAIAVDDGRVTYPVTVYDAPGEGSTYTLGGSYDIPAELSGVRMVLVGQAVQSSGD